MYSSTTAEEKLIDARMALLSKYKWWGYLAMNVVFVEDNSMPTTAVNAKGTFFYNKTWIEEMSIEDLMFEIAHELMHIVQKCIARFPSGGCFLAWNLAADYIVDTYLIGEHNDGIPPSARSKHMVSQEVQNKIRSNDMTTEEVYRKLFQDNTPKENKEKNTRGCESGTKGTDGDQGEEGKGKKPEDVFGEEAQLKWQKIMLSAEQVAIEADQQGSIPANVKDFLIQLRHPTVNWTDKIRYTATAVFRGRYTFKKPNKRAHHLGIRLQTKKKIPEGAVLMFDTSGSVSEDELIQAASEAVAIIESCGAAYAHVFFHDVVCYYHAKYTADEMNNIKVTRGGTSHIHVFETMEKELEDIGMVVAFTDLESSFPEEEPKYPILWCCSKRSIDHDIPYGKKIEMTLNA